VRCWLRRLPARQREVIVLRYWAELPEAQIAAALGISLGAVKSSASRGRDAIAAALSSGQRGQQ
jgi:RNA polymerase sigma factor (sigma-70 family)